MSQRGSGRSWALGALAGCVLVLALGFTSSGAWGSIPTAAGFEVVQGAPPASPDAGAGADLILIPRDWQSRYPFSGRFAAPEAGGGTHVIDLRAFRFATDALRRRDERGAVTFLGPDTSSFPAHLLRPPFSDGAQDYFLVQASSPQEQIALRTWLEGEGIPILDYIPEGAYLLRLTRADLARVQERPEVFWAGPFQPAFRINPKLDYVIETSPTHRMVLEATFDRALYADAGSLLRASGLSQMNVEDVTATAVGWRVRLAAEAGFARDLAVLEGCLWVERYVRPELDNNVARSSANTPTGRGAQSGPMMDVEDVWSRGIRGEGQIASAADTGLSTGTLSTLHYDFGQQGSGANPMRVLKGYALGRSGWDDDMGIGGGHGTHTSGSIVGNGVRSGASPSSNSFPSTSFAGTAPKAQFVFQSVMDSSGNLGGIPSDLTTLFQAPYTDGARVHSNSWGAAVAGDYTTTSQDVDRFTWTNKDMVITFSAGNSGRDGHYVFFGYCYTSGDPVDGVIDDDSIGAPGTAKNCITVGASENYRPDFIYEYPQGDCTGDGFAQQAWGWFNGCTFATAPIYADLMANNASGLAAFSSRGPTNDGRFKPDVVAPGVGIISTKSDQNPGYEQWGVCNVPGAYQNYYMTQGGTSMSNPLTAGTAVLVRQYYQDGWHPNHSQTTNGSASPSHGFAPSSALVKATLINGAWDMAPGQYGTGATREIPPNWDTGHDLPNNAEGYGRVDLEHSLFPGSGWGDVSQRKLEVHDAAPGLQTGQSKDYPVAVASNANPLIVTLVWTDPYGAVSAGTELVNDLDLTVTSPTGTAYYPNGLNKTSGADHTNNVEQVKVTSPGAGTWTVRINGTSVPGNGQDGSTTQPYALVISGVITPPCTTPPGTPSGLTATAPAAGQIALSWSAGSPAGTSYHVYRASGSCPATGFTQIAGAVSGTAYTDTTVAAGRTYAYYVTAQLEGCESDPSNCASARALGICNSPPTFPGLATVGVASGGSCALALDWADGTYQCDGPLTYSVYRSTSPSFVPTPSTRIAAGVTATAYTDSARLTGGVPYYYIVRAVDESNHLEDGNSVVKTGTTAGGGGPQTLFSSDFETGSGLANWGIANFYSGSTTSDWQGIQACAAHGGSQIFRFGGATCTAAHSNYDFVGVVPAGSTGIAFPSGASSARLSFWHRWDLETGYDGAVILLSNDHQTYFLLPESVILSGAYNGTTSSYCPPAGGGGRSVWTGTQGTFQNTVVDLDAAYDFAYGGSGGVAGQTIYIAFAVITDCSNSQAGWFLDDVAVTSGDTGGPCTTCPALSVTSVDNSQCPTVKVNLAATDTAGSPLGGLTGSSFGLSEEGSAQSFTSLDLGGGNYQLSFATTRLDGQLHPLDLSMTSGGCTVHTASSVKCIAACSVTCTATVPATGQPGQAVSFAATASPISCSGSPTYSWTFGDGATSTSQNPAHTYTNGGSFNWTLTVAVDGKTCAKNGTIAVINPPVVTSLKKSSPPFTITAMGSNFQSGIKVFINGVEWTSLLYKTTAKLKITGGTPLKVAVPKGVPTTFLFRNPDGGQTSVTWSW